MKGNNQRVNAPAAIWLGYLNYFFSKERSVKAYCQLQLRKSESKRLHIHNKNKGGAYSKSDQKRNVCPQKAANAFNDLEEVTPEDIQPTVGPYRDTWKSLVKSLGSSASILQNYQAADKKGPSAS